MQLQFVSVQGYLHSGSGAVNDLLREYRNVTVLSHSGDCGTGQDAPSSVGEIVFLRILPWFALRDAIESNDPWRQDNLIKSFIVSFYGHLRTAASSAFYRDNPVILSPEFRALIYNFLCELLKLSPEEKKYITSHPDYVFPVTYQSVSERPFSFNRNTYCLYVLREGLTRREMDNLLKKTFTGILNLYAERCAPSSSLIVGDQMLSGYDVESVSPYFTNLKQIVVYRDIRDHYLWMIKAVNPMILKVLNVESFIGWVKALKIGQPDSTESQLCLRFEDLLYDYDATVSRIERFLGIDPAWHVRPRQYLIPELSRRNCQLYHQYPDKALIQRLEETFPQLCYFQD